jgi:hypothetical protein
MGMRTYAVDDYGLYVTKKDFKLYAEMNDWDVREMLHEIGNSYGGAEGECFLIMKDERDTFDPVGSFAILPVGKYPSLFTQVYENKEAAVTELKEKYAEYLPADFDYEGKFVHFVGTIYG